MKRILTTMCALTLLLAASVPALAAEPEQSASYYPTSVEEYMEGDSPRIKKVYQLSLADDPSQIPTEDFERDGRLYYLLDMTRKDELGWTFRPSPRPKLWPVRPTIWRRSSRVWNRRWR